MKKLTLSFAVLSLLSSCFALTSFHVSAHGYVVEPQSRTYKCAVKDKNEKTKIALNKNCGDAVTYDPHSIEGLKGFPAAGPANGSIASGGVKKFNVLDEQTPVRWHKTNIKTGPTTFTWFLKVAHKTTNWRFFITKTGWNQSKALTRESFDLKPFCQRDDNSTMPPLKTDINFNCTIPKDRTGYHVILATWDVSDTQNAFYQAIDVNITN